MKTNSLLRTLILPIALLLASLNLATAQIYVMTATNIDPSGSHPEINGDSKISGHVDKIEIQNIDLAFSSSLVPGSGAAQINSRDLEVFITMKIDRKAHPKLFKAAVSNHEIVFEIFEIQEVTEGVYRTEQRIKVTGFLKNFQQDGTTGDSAFVGLGILPKEIEIQTFLFNPDGSPGTSPSTEVWNIRDW